jgi:hypothetical protein
MDKSRFDANNVEGAFWDGAGLTWPRPGIRNINGEKDLEAEKPPQPTQIKLMTDASNNDFTMEPTLTTPII